MRRKAIRWMLPAIVAAAALTMPAVALGAGAPVIEAENVLVGGASTARVEAQIQPGASETNCSVQYVTEPLYLESQWTHASEQPCAEALAGGAGVQTRYVSLSGLTVATAYRYRVLAKNAAGATAGPPARYSTFAIESFAFEAFGEHGEPFTQAGGHPYELQTNIRFDTTHFENPLAKAGSHYVPVVPEGVVRDVKVELPAGLIGNPAAVPQCTYVSVELKSCNPSSQIGVIEVEENGNVSREAGLFNMVTPKGVAALFGARMNQVLNTTMEAKVRSGGDYGVDVASLRITGFGTINRISVRMWGVPGAEGHTPERWCEGNPGTCPATGAPSAVEGPYTPFLTMPTVCGGSLTTGLGVDSYQGIGDFAGAFELMPSMSGCGRVAFAPELEAAPTTGSADSPTGMTVNLKVPQQEGPEGTATSDLKDASVTLPAGVAVDPSSAAGLEGCTPEEVGLNMAESERQRLLVDPRVDRSFTLAFAGAQTPVLPAEASPAIVQQALEGLPGIGTGNVKVEGGAGGAFTVAFTGALAGRSLPAITLDASRRSVEHVDLKLAEDSEVIYPNDSFNVTVGGFSTAASVDATVHLVAENTETRVIGYIEESSITARKGKFVTGETITGPGIPEKVRVRLKAGRTELVRYMTSAGPPKYVTGEFTGTFDMAIPDTAFHETIDEALEALPPVAYARTFGGPIGGHGAGAYNPRQGHSTFEIAYEPAAGYEAEQLVVTSGIEEVPQTMSSSFQPGGSETTQATIVQQGGVPNMNKEPAKCPAASKIASVKVKTPLLEHELPGALYLATPHDNPFHSLIALYLAVYDPISGVVIKLPGSVSLNKETGQITTTFENSPQLPFSELKVEIFGANEAAAKSRAPLTTPQTCGSYTSTSVLTPWDGNPAATPQSKAFAIGSEPGGGACPATEAQAPNTPGFVAGTASPVAGTYSPFVLKLARQDGSQRFGALDVTLPPGMTGKVAGVEECPQADIEAAEHLTAEGDGAVEVAHPSCPAGSKVGVVHVGAGSGAPLFVNGTAYFAGPYEGAPFSLVFVTPAIAGPFDLGVVTVRAALYIDPHTAQVTVKSDPFPTILDGIPLDIRSVGVEMNRPGFTLNPTSCNVMAVTGSLISTANQTAGLSDRFQVGGCDTMPFKPSFSAETHAFHSRKDGAYLHVHVGYGSGQANIAKVHVAIPNVLPARNDTLKLACTEEQFNKNPAGCPEGSIIGHAVAHTPILPVPLEGPVLFVSHGSRGFPDVEVLLKGDGVNVTLEGETFINKKGETFSTFGSVPDVPVSSFDLYLPEGPHSALAGNGNLCAKPLYMPTAITGQNGALVQQQTRVKVSGCKPELRIRKHEIKRGKATIVVQVPSAGKLIASGKGITTARKNAARAKVMSVTVRLKKGSLRMLAHHPHRELRVIVRLRFKPKHGKTIGSSLAVMLR